MKNKGQLQIGVLAGVISLVASIGVPFVWVGNVKGEIESKNNVQDVQITTLQATTQETREDIKEIRRGLNALLLKEGINPDKLNNK